jgi:hypothetical protein
MSAEKERRDIEFKTFDGLTLRGSMYVGPKGGPSIIVNGAVRYQHPAVNLLKQINPNFYSLEADLVDSSCAPKRFSQSP